MPGTQYKPGDKIPTELQLSEFYQVSRVTVRQALAKLVNEQILVKKSGKGTFVKPPMFVENFFAGGSFTDTCLRMKAVPSTKIICKELIPSPLQLIEKLGDSVVHITRLRLVNNVPCIIEEDYFPSSGDFLLHTDIEQLSLLSFVYEKTGLMPAKFEDRFRIAHANKHYAALLQCSSGHPLLEVTQNVMTNDETLIYINQQYIFSVRYVYAVRS